MGESKRKQQDRQSNGSGSTSKILTAYEAVYGMVEAVYTEAGGVTHQLLGIDFDGDAVTGVNYVGVTRKEAVSELVAGMLKKWDVVVHVFEGWHSSRMDGPPSQASDKQDIVSITVHTQSSVHVAVCFVNEAAKSIEKAELVPVDGIGGVMGRSLPTQH
jgi:hypothetical protein